MDTIPLELEVVGDAHPVLAHGGTFGAGAPSWKVVQNSALW
jgi:hypothetical protein